MKGAAACTARRGPQPISCVKPVSNQRLKASPWSQCLTANSQSTATEKTLALFVPSCDDRRFSETAKCLIKAALTGKVPILDARQCSVTRAVVAELPTCSHSSEETSASNDLLV